MGSLSSHCLKIGKGTKIIVQSGREVFVGLVSYISVEAGHKIYDYEDQYGNFRWCFDNEVVHVIA